MSFERGPLLAQDAVTGAAWCRAHSDLVDAWLADLLRAATGEHPAGYALVAVGGYGRSELCPQSDIDVMLLHDRQPDVKAVADAIWYPIWDEGLHLGHSVRTVGEALGFAENDLDTATALLSARHVAGDADLTAKLADGAAAQWEKRSKHWLSELDVRVEQRHESAGEVAFHLEPDLKEGRGGLRDVHALHWAEAAHRVLLDHDAVSLTAAYNVLLDARVELQRHAARPSNVLVLHEQDAVATALGLGDGDALMAGVAEAARTIAWTSDDTWRRIRSSLRGPLGRLGRRSRTIEPGIELVNGEIHLDEVAMPADDPVVVLRAAATAAGERTVLDRRTLERLATAAPAMPDPWPEAARTALVQLLLTGHAAIRVIEALDQRGVWERLLPEWAPVRALPQRNAYHRFTVDRHLLETTANAAQLADRVDRPDLLVLAALLHDLGKGHDGDHVETSVALTRRIATRLGLWSDDAATVIALVEHHLLLSDVATRRDLDDPVTIEKVGSAVHSVERLQLLAALTEADSLATGSSAWGAWKADLVRQLVDRVTRFLNGEGAEPLERETFPTAAHLARLGDGQQYIDTNDNVLTVMSADRPGTFSRVAGVLALHGLDVLAAAAHSTAVRALAEFHVADPIRPEIPWSKVLPDLEHALAGRLAINARLAERVRTYGKPKPSAAKPVSASVHFDDDASAGATVIDVQAADGIGVLYRITRALAELDLDIRSAKVETRGTHVVDSFYVRDATGGKITDPRTRGEIERAILHSLSGE